nr:hypothetical protein [uncultured Acetatifactor sp.]
MKQKYGQCHICGENTKLSYEHIPPSSAFNKISRKMVGMDILSMNGQNEWTLQGQKYKSFQKGFGDFTLCEKCNTITGSKYGAVYTKIVQAVGSQILQIPQENKYNELKITIEKINCLAFFKQIISMFCSVNTANWGMQFKEYLLNPENNEFNTDRYKICTYLHRGTMDRVCSMCVLWNPLNGTSKEVSEISFFPFGFILYDSKHVTDNTTIGTDISAWGTKAYKEEQLEISIPSLICNTGKILDFE